MTLRGLVMRHAVLVALIVVLATTVLAFWRTRVDASNEVDSAMALVKHAVELAQLDEAAMGEVSRQGTVSNGRHARHVTLTMAPAQTPPYSRVATDTNSWPVGPSREWEIHATPTDDDELHEAALSLGGVIVVTLLGVLLLLFLINRDLRAALSPVDDLLAVVERIESGRHDIEDALPATRVAEVDRLAQALRKLSEALVAADRDRRQLRLRMLTLQESERTNLARELHDEFGQRLTALRADIAWLARRLAGDSEGKRVLEEISHQCETLQIDIRHTLSQLMPLGITQEGDHESLDRLEQLLNVLVQRWRSKEERAPAIRLVCRSTVGSPWPADAAAIGLPRELVLAIYRISQEALTNAVRHARAQHIDLEVIWVPVGLDVGRIEWAVRDDGIGAQRSKPIFFDGMGLAGMRERVWALGSELLYWTEKGRGTHLRCTLNFPMRQLQVDDEFWPSGFLGSRHSQMTAGVDESMLCRPALAGAES